MLADYPVFRSPGVILQSSGTFVYSREHKTFDVLNREASLFLQHMTGEFCGDEIVQAIAADYGIAEATVAADYSALIALLEARGYVELLPREADPVDPFSSPPDRRVRAVHADIELTKECNLACSYCYADAGRQRGPVRDFDFWRSLLDQLYDQGLRVVKLSGGEPYLHPDFRRIAEFCAARFITALNSNGTFITNAEAAWLAGLDLQVVQISLDSMDAAIHDAQRGRGTWKLARRAIDRLVRHGVPLRISCTATAFNDRGIPALAQFAAEIGAELSVEPLRGRGRAELLPDSHFAGQCESDWQATVRNEYRALAPLGFRCQAQLGFVGLSADGSLKPCNLTESFFAKMQAAVVEPVSAGFVYEESSTFRQVSAACDAARTVPLSAETCVLSIRNELTPSAPDSAGA